MANNVALATPNNQPPPWLGRLSASVNDMGGKPTLPSGISVTLSQVSEIRDHVRLLRERMATGSRAETTAKAQAITMLFSVLASEPLPANLAELRQLAYLETVADVPAWAVQQAARMWRDGIRPAEGENRNFVPKPAELMRLVNIVARPAADELDRTERLLIAAENATREPTDDERTRVAAGFDSLRSELRPVVSETQLRDDAVSGLRKRAGALGHDFDALMDSIPDQPHRGSFSKLGGVR